MWMVGDVSSEVWDSQMLMGDGWILAAGDGNFSLNFVLNTEEGLCV